MAKRFRRGQIVAVTFLDHVEDGSDPEEFTIYGRLAEVSRRHICVDCWAYVDSTKAHDDNVKRFTIVRSAIVTWDKLVPVTEPGSPDSRGQA